MAVASLVGLGEKSKRRPGDALEQGPLRLRAGKDPNAPQDGEQQAREIFGGAVARDRTFGLRRLDGAMEKGLDLSKTVGNEGTQLPVVRRHLKRRVDQKAAPPFTVLHRMLDDFLDEPANGLFWRQRSFKARDQSPRWVIVIVFKRPRIRRRLF